MSATPRDSARYASPLLTPQWRVEALLRTRLIALGGRIEWDTELVGIDQANDDRVVASVRIVGKQERIESKWLVGCDGGQSSVRKRIGLPFVGETFEQIRMWVDDLIIEGLDRDHWHLWREGDGFLALCPLPGTDQFQFQARIAADEQRSPSLAAFDDMVRQRTGRSDIRLLTAGWLSSWRANVRMVEQFREGLVLLAGDAAHVHSPAGAQGMNTGIQDAYNLGWKLAAVLAGADETLVDTYQEERLPVARGVLGLSTELTRTAFSPDLRRDERTSQLDLNYRASSLSVDIGTVSPTIRAGDRAPDVGGLQSSDGSIHRLFELLRGTHVTIIVFGSDRSTIQGLTPEGSGERLRLISIIPAGSTMPDCWSDERGDAWRIYAPAPNAFFVIRPDGYVGLTGSTADSRGLASYLCTIIGVQAAASSACGASLHAGNLNRRRLENIANMRPAEIELLT